MWISQSATHVVRGHSGFVCSSGLEQGFLIQGFARCGRQRQHKEEARVFLKPKWNLKYKCTLRCMANVEFFAHEERHIRIDSPILSQVSVSLVV